MSPTYAPTTICNRALREVPDRQIASLEENSLQARECSAAYADCVAEVLEDHPWTFAVSRLPLAQLSTNPRPNEWSYAYAVPDDAAFVGKVMTGYQGQANPLGWGAAVPNVTLNGYRNIDVFADTGRDFMDRAPGWTMKVEGGVIFTDCPSAVCEYTSNAIPEANFTPQFVRALAMRIACRISTALTKDQARLKGLWQMAELESGRAKATDSNRQRDTYGDTIPDWIAVR